MCFFKIIIISNVMIINIDKFIFYYLNFELNQLELIFVYFVLLILHHFKLKFFNITILNYCYYFA